MSPLRVLAFAPAAAGQPSPAVRAVPAAAPPPAAALAAWRDASASIWLDATDPGPDELDSLVDALDLEDVPELPAAGGGATARPRPRLARYDHSASLRLYVPHPGALALGPIDDLPGARARRRTRAGRPASGSAGAAAADVRVVTGSLTLLDPLLIYFGPRFLLTVHDHPLPLLDGVAERARAAGATRAVNTATLLHDVLVAQLDASGDVLDHLAEIAESREAATFGTGPQARRALRSLGRVRRDLFSLRRIATAQRSALTVLARDPTIIPHAPGDGDAPTFEGVLDRAVRLEQAIAVQHGLMISARAAHHSWVAAGVTRVTRRLLIVTCLVAVPTLVVSVYGMNFAGQPELSLGIGHLWAILVALSVDGGLWLYLRHRHWV